MTGADASAASIALAAAPLPARPDDAPLRAGERWTGSYRCAQGKTELSILVEEVTRGDEENSYEIDAILEFHFDGGVKGFAPADGSARMHGKYDGKQLRFKGVEWIDQPTNYQLVDFVGTLRGSSYSGRVEGPGCTSFSVTRDSLVDTPPEKGRTR